MRNYNEVTTEISSVKKKLDSTTKFIAESQTRIKMLEKQKEQYLTGFKTQCETLKNQQLLDLKNSIKNKYKKPRKAIEQSIQDVNTLFNEKCAKFSPDYFLEKYSDETTQIKNCTNLAKEIEELCCTTLGTALTESITANLNNVTLKLNEQDIANYLNMNKDISTELVKLQKYFNSDLSNKIYKILTKVDPSVLLNSKKEQDPIQKRNVALIYSGICLTITGALMYFCSGFLFIIILTIGIFNVYKSKQIKDLLYNSKILQDNASEILEKFKQYASEDSQEALQQLEKNKGLTLAKLEKELEQYKKKEMLDLQKAEHSFKFDETALIAQRDNAIEAKNKDITSIKKSINFSVDEKKDLEFTLENLETELQEVIANLKESCLSFNGTATSFEPTYILDISDSSVLTWQYSKTSALFVYQGEPDFTSTFIRLFVGQTMSKFKPSYCRIDIVDTLNLAMNYRVFEKVTDDPKDKARGCCAIVIDSEGFSNLQDFLTMELKTRAQEIFSECANIEEYNDIMEEVGGVRKEYLFYIFDHYPFKFLGEETTKQLLIQGAALGIYALFFVTKEELIQEKSIFLKCLPSIGKCYNLESDNITGITADSLISFINEKK